MLYHYHCHRPWRFAPCPHRALSRCPLCVFDRVLPPPGFTPPGGGEKNRPSRVARGNSGRETRAWNERGLGTRIGRQFGGQRVTVAASVDGSALLLEIPCARSGSKDDGTQQQRIVAAPSDSEPRTGRPARLNTWEFAAVVATTLPLLRPSFSVPFSSVIRPTSGIYIYLSWIVRCVLRYIRDISRTREGGEKKFKKRKGSG